MVFPAFGGATINPRCPFPTGAIKSIILFDSSLGSVSSLICLVGNIAVSDSNLVLDLDSSGSKSLTDSTLINPQYLAPSLGGRVFPFIMSPVLN